MDPGAFPARYLFSGDLAALHRGSDYRNYSKFCAHHRRIWRRTNGRRKYSRRNANCFHRYLRSGAGRQLRRRESHGSDPAAVFFPDPFRNLRDESQGSEPVAETLESRTQKNMSLEVEIEKQLPGFRLAVKFTADGSPLGLLGPSGSGQTMTLRAIAGLEAPDRGRIVLHGRVLFDSARHINVPARERRIGLLFQNYALFPHLTVAQNIEFGLRRMALPERVRRVEQQLAAAHLDALAGRYPASLSGGEQQRVALARALAVEPEALLLDEPFSALDTHLRSALERQLRETLQTYRGSTLFVSHNLEETYRVCSDLVVLVRGGVAAQGPKEELFRHPPTVEVARLTGCKNFSQAGRTPDGLIEALDWGCALHVTQEF